MKQIRYLALIALANLSTHCARVYLGGDIYNKTINFSSQGSPAEVPAGVISFKPSSNKDYFGHTYLEIPDIDPTGTQRTAQGFCANNCINSIQGPSQALIDVSMILTLGTSAGAPSINCNNQCAACNLDGAGNAVINAFGGGAAIWDAIYNLNTGHKSISLSINKGITQDMLPKGKLIGKDSANNNIYRYTSPQDLAEDLFASYAKIMWMCYNGAYELQYCLDGSNCHTWYTPSK